MPETAVVHIFEDPARGLALVRGTHGTKDVLSAAGLLDVARYSVTGKGWCLPVGHVRDLCAAAETVGAIYRIRQVQP